MGALTLSDAEKAIRTFNMSAGAVQALAVDAAEARTTDNTRAEFADTDPGYAGFIGPTRGREAEISDTNPIHTSLIQRAGDIADINTAPFATKLIRATVDLSAGVGDALPRPADQPHLTASLIAAVGDAEAIYTDPLTALRLFTGIEAEAILATPMLRAVGGCTGIYTGPFATDVVGVWTLHRDRAGGCAEATDTDLITLTQVPLVDLSITIVVLSITDLFREREATDATGVDQILIDTTIAVVVHEVTDLLYGVLLLDTTHEAIEADRATLSADPR